MRDAPLDMRTGLIGDDVLTRVLRHAPDSTSRSRLSWPNEKIVGPPSRLPRGGRAT